jgi:hypothetical protein
MGWLTAYNNNKLHVKKELRSIKGMSRKYQDEGGGCGWKRPFLSGEKSKFNQKHLKKLDDPSKEAINSRLFS